MAGEDLKYIDSILELAEENWVDVSVDPNGHKINVHALEDNKQSRFIIDRLKQAAKNNRSALIWKLKNKTAAEPPESDTSALGIAEQTAKGTALDVAKRAPEFGILAGQAMGVPTIPLIGLGTELGAASSFFKPDSSMAGQAALGGLEAAAPAVMEKAIGAPIYAYKWFQRPGKVMSPNLTADLGAVMKQYLEKIAPKSSQQIIEAVSELSNKSGKNTIKRILNSDEMDAEAVRSYQKMVKTAVDAIDEDAQQELRTAKAAFKAKFGKLRGKNLTENRAAQTALKELREKAKIAQTAKKDAFTAFQKIGQYTRTSNYQAGGLKFTNSAWQAAEQSGKLQEKLYGLLHKVDSSGQLRQMVQEMRDDYGKFQSFRRLVNTKNSMDPTGTWFNPQALQRLVDGQTNPAVRFIKRAMKDAYGPVRDVVRRYAPEFSEKGIPTVADRPMLSGKIAAGEHVPGLRGYLRSLIPMPQALTHFIGSVPPINPTEVPTLLKAAPIATTGIAKETGER